MTQSFDCVTKTYCFNLPFTQIYFQLRICWMFFLFLGGKGCVRKNLHRFAGQQSRRLNYNGLIDQTSTRARHSVVLSGYLKSVGGPDDTLYCTLWRRRRRKRWRRRKKRRRTLQCIQICFPSYYSMKMTYFL